MQSKKSVPSAHSICNKIKPVLYFGYLQGFKIWLNGEKFPRKHGHFYTAMNWKEAVKHAENDLKMEVKS